MQITVKKDGLKYQYLVRYERTKRINRKKMSKMSEIDLIAQGVADVTLELMRDSVDWQIADQPINGDEYNKLHSMVLAKAIEYMYLQTK